MLRSHTPLQRGRPPLCHCKGMPVLLTVSSSDLPCCLQHLCTELMHPALLCWLTYEGLWLAQGMRQGSTASQQYIVSI